MGEYIVYFVKWTWKFDCVNVYVHHVHMYNTSCTAHVHVRICTWCTRVCTYHHVHMYNTSCTAHVRVFVHNVHVHVYTYTYECVDVGSRMCYSVHVVEIMMVVQPCWGAGIFEEVQPWQVTFLISLNCILDVKPHWLQFWIRGCCIEYSLYSNMTLYNLHVRVYVQYVFHQSMCVGCCTAGCSCPHLCRWS